MPGHRLWIALRRMRVAVIVLCCLLSRTQQCYQLAESQTNFSLVLHRRRRPLGRYSARRTTRLLGAPNVYATSRGGSFDSRTSSQTEDGFGIELFAGPSSLTVCVSMSGPFLQVFPPTAVEQC